MPGQHAQGSQSLLPEGKAGSAKVVRQRLFFSASGLLFATDPWKGKASHSKETRSWDRTLLKTMLFLVITVWW